MAIRIKETRNVENGFILKTGHGKTFFRTESISLRFHVFVDALEICRFTSDERTITQQYVWSVGVLMRRVILPLLCR